MSKCRPTQGRLLREARGAAQAGGIGDREVGGRFDLYRLNKGYDRVTN